MQPGDTVHPGSDDATTDQPQGVPVPTPPVDLPAVTPAEDVTPSTGAPLESVPTEAANQDLQADPVEEQSSDDQNRGDTTPPPAAPPKGGAGTALPSEPGMDVAPTNPDTAESEAAAEAAPDQNSSSQFSWVASEYIEHHHGLGWYAALTLVALGGAALSALVLKELLSGVLVLIMSVAVAVYANRKPQSLEYQVSDQGVKIGDKLMPFSEFKAFAVIPTNSLVTIELDPVKRFMPSLSIILDNTQVDQAEAILGRHLPHEDRQMELVDRLAHALKF